MLKIPQRRRWVSYGGTSGAILGGEYQSASLEFTCRLGLSTERFISFGETLAEVMKSTSCLQTWKEFGEDVHVLKADQLVNECARDFFPGDDRVLRGMHQTVKMLRTLKEKSRWWTPIFPVK